jgi:hypothetical protein
VLALLLCLVQATDGGLPTPGDVSRAFLDLPAISAGRPHTPERRAALERAFVDTLNGYLRISAPVGRGEERLELAVFRRANGTFIVGLVKGTRRWPGQDRLSFHEVRDGAWVDLTNEVLPAGATSDLLDERDGPFDETGHEWSLPQEGTTLTVVGLYERSHGLKTSRTRRFAWNRRAGVFTELGGKSPRTTPRGR